MSTTAQLANLLFKKGLGNPSTLDARLFFQEPNLPARSAVFQSQIYAEEVPSVAPSDLTSLTDSSLDDNGFVMKGSYAGKTSSLFPQIKRFIKIPLTEIIGTTGQAYECLTPTYSHPLGYADNSTPTNYGQSATYTKVLQSSVPFNADPLGSYIINVYRSTGTEIPFGTGTWLFDAEAGVLTFYNIAGVSGVSSSTPPLFSGYVYVGQFGGSASGSASTEVTTTENTYTVKQIFAGGATSGTGDNLQTIVVDNRDLAAFTGSTMAVQFGSNADGSWRICLSGGSGVATATKFEIQARVGGVWLTKNHLEI
jgi:hypothetical protein